MREPEKQTNPLVRIALAQTVQNFIDNPYCLWKDGCTDEDTENLKKYLRDKGIPVPNIPKDEREEGAKKALYLLWAAFECNNCICALMGCEE